MFVLYNKCLLACLLFEKKKKADRREFASHLFRIASLQKKKKKNKNPPERWQSTFFSFFFFFFVPGKISPVVLPTRNQTCGHKPYLSKFNRTIGTQALVKTVQRYAY